MRGTRVSMRLLGNGALVRFISILENSRSGGLNPLARNETVLPSSPDQRPPPALTALLCLTILGIMSLQWMAVATFLYIEVFFVLLLCIPFISPKRSVNVGPPQTHSPEPPGLHLRATI